MAIQRSTLAAFATHGIHVLICVLLFASSGHGDEIDLNGSWQLSATIDCGSSIYVVQITEDVSTGALSQVKTDCGTVVGSTYGLARPSGCDTDPVAGQVTGNAVAVPPSGLTLHELLFAPPVVDPQTGCGTTPVSRITTEARFDGTITDDGGVGVRIDGQATLGVNTSYDDTDQMCSVFDYGTVPVCTFVMLRNDVVPGSDVRIEPIEGASVTFATVTGAGTATVTPLSAPDGDLPANFQVADTPLYFDVTTTATVSGIVEVCLPYSDGDHDGFLDDTTPPIDENTLLLLHEEGGVFVDRTTTRDTATNSICAQTSSLSQFIYGALLSTTTTSISSTTSSTLPTTDLLPGRVTVIKPGVLAKFVAKPYIIGDTFILPTGNPISAGGSLRIFDISATAGDNTYDLPPGANWKGLGNPPGLKGYKYADQAQNNGPCKVILIRDTVIKGICKGPGVTLAPPFTGDVAIVLSLGTTDRYCAKFGGNEVKSDTTIEKRTYSSAPGACP